MRTVYPSKTDRHFDQSKNVSGIKGILIELYLSFLYANWSESVVKTSKTYIVKKIRVVNHTFLKIKSSCSSC